MKIIVIDNNQEYNNYICNILTKLMFQNNHEYQILSFYKYNNKLKKLIHDNDTKIYIVDLKLQNISGYDICREIREDANDWNSIIIISSAYNQKEHIISLRLLIFTYLVKLNNFENNLRDALEKAINILNSNNFLIIDRNTKVAINDICYIKKIKNSKYCSIKTIHNDEIRIRKSLKYLEKTLKFRKVKNYLLVNDKNISLEIKDEVIFKNSDKIVLY